VRRHGPFIPVSEDQGRSDAAAEDALSHTKLEAMIAVWSVGLDMFAAPGDTPASILTGIIADELAIGMVNHRATAVRVIPFSCDLLHRHGGRIPAPIQSVKNQEFRGGGAAPPPSILLPEHLVEEVVGGRERILDVGHVLDALPHVEACARLVLDQGGVQAARAAQPEVLGACGDVGGDVRVDRVVPGGTAAPDALGQGPVRAEADGRPQGDSAHGVAGLHVRGDQVVQAPGERGAHWRIGTCQLEGQVGGREGAVCSPLPVVPIW